MDNEGRALGQIPDKHIQFPVVDKFSKSILPPILPQPGRLEIDDAQDIIGTSTRLHIGSIHVTCICIHN